MSSKLTPTALPTPPKEYDVGYMDRLVKQIALEFTKQRAITPITCGSDLSGEAGFPISGLTIVNPPVSSTGSPPDGFPEGSVWCDTTSENSLKIITSGPYTDQDSLNLANTTDPALGDALIGFRQSNASGNLTGAVGKTVHDKLQDFISVKDFGADPTGVTDSTAAIQAAINSAIANRKSLGGMVAGFSAPEVHFPEGAIYKVTGNISVGQGIKLFGNKAIITSGTYPYPQINPLFINVGPESTIDGFVTFGFTDVISIATANLDAVLIEIKNCEIQEWSGYAIFVDNNSASTLLKINNNKFYARVASAWVLKNECDVCLFDDNWVQGPCDTFFWNTKQLFVRGMYGVPNSSTSVSRWILNEGTQLTCRDCRFGGESGARTIVDQSTGPGGTNATKLVVENCEVWSTGFPVIRFNDIPDVFAFTRNYGLNGAYTFQFNTIPSTTKDLFGTRNTWTVEENEFVVIGGLRSSSEDVIANNKSVVIENVRAALGTETFTSADVVRNILYTEAGFGNTGSISAGMSTSTSTDFFGATVRTINGINGDSQFNTTWVTLLAGLAAGSYTMLVNVAVNSGASVLLTLNAGNNIRTENLTLGKYTLAVPFYFDGTNATNCGYAIKNICAGTQFADGGLRIVAGTVDGYKKWNTECLGTAAPTSGYWRLGDRVFNSTPTAGVNTGWVCTTAGTPGTWMPFGQAGVVTSIAATPSYIGQIAAVAGVGYLATGVASPADWTQIT